jgi:4-amino-4-deoxy-L-arabinose transferase-like glycosyltransferase
VKRLAIDGTALIVLVPGLLVVMAHAFLPHDELIHRGDDAYYYFGVATGFPERGWWSFDGLVSTNGVQPLWGAVLTGVAQVLDWTGLDGLEGFERLSVGLTALCWAAAAVLLYAILARTVSRGAGLAAAGALLFSLPIVWPHVWGMENSIYALTLLAAVAFYEFRFRREPTTARTVILGVLLGLTALSRLNAVMFVGVLLGWYVLSARDGVGLRLRRAAVIAAVAGAVVVPYVVANLAVTGHLLPISGTVKAIERDELRERRGASSVVSVEYLKAAVSETYWPLRKFAQSRAADGLWIGGSRAVFRDDAFVGASRLLLALVVLLALPLLVGPPGRWIRHLWARLVSLGRFGHLALFALLNAGVSAVLYPTEANYAMPSWWLVESEIVIVATVATIAATSLGYVARSIVPRRALRIALPLGLAALVAFSCVQAATFFWDGENQTRDWHSSWNDESMLAAEWLGRNVPHDAVVGSWNAGVLGYHAPQEVINLDGVINNEDLLPHLERGNVSDYIVERRIEYVSDMEMAVERFVGDELELTQVYQAYSELLGRHYRIYRVDGPST